MASTTKKNLRRAAKKVERQRRIAIGARPPQRPKRGGRFNEPPFQFPEDPEGGAGVREPRRPFPTAPAGAMELEYEKPEYVDLVH
jgi:hypothetical protein